MIKINDDDDDDDDAKLTLYIEYSLKNRLRFSYCHRFGAAFSCTKSIPCHSSSTKLKTIKIKNISKFVFFFGDVKVPNALNNLVSIKTEDEQTKHGPLSEM